MSPKPPSTPGPDTRYGGVAIGLHWLIAIAILSSFLLGFYMSDLPLSPQKLKFYSWHKWAGVTIFLFVLVRLVWRLSHRPPELPGTIPAWQRKVAAATHVLLYLLMLAVPFTGWLMSSAKGFQTVYFGVLPIPDLLTKNKELGDLLQTVHMSLNLLFVVVIAGHIGAALKHHFIDKDDILTRMLPKH